MVNYDTACVYKLCCTDVSIKEIYVGSTCAFKQRKSNHKHDCNNEMRANYDCYVYQFIRDNGGFNNWDMIQIEMCSVKTKRELETRERFHIESLGASLNKCLPTRSNKEYREANKERIVEYYKANKEQIAEKHKVYHEANKEQLSENKKVYYKANKEQITEKRAIKIQCDCGSSIRYCDLSRHKKSLKHKAYEATLNPI